MKFINNFKNILFFILFSIFLFTGCSSKSSNYDYSSFYKDTHNANINNSLAMHRATMRPYTVFGIKYYPEIAKVGERFNGIASWYGPDFHAKKTSNGEIYNMYAMTAAHKTLPMNTVVRVDNLDNGRSTIVRINDRGPFVSGRIIDLSNKAAHEIDMVRKGTAKVQITVLGYNGEINNNEAPDVLTEKSPINSSTAFSGGTESLDLKDDIITTTEVSNNIGKAVNTGVSSKVSTTVKNTQKANVKGNFSVQVGAFSLVSGAQQTQSTYQKKFPSKKVEYVENGGIYRVFIRGFSSYDEAQNFKNSNNLTNAMVVQ